MTQLGLGGKLAARGQQAMREALIINRPADTSSAPQGLLPLFHGVGSNAEDLTPLDEGLASHAPHSWVISVRSPDRSDFGSGWQWFSVQGVTVANRSARVAAAMRSLGGVATLDLFAGLEHDIDSRVARRFAEHLGTPTP